MKPKVIISASAQICRIGLTFSSYHNCAEGAGERPAPKGRMRIPWAHYLSEFAGTALLIAAGLSVVIFDFGQGSPMLVWLPGAALRRLVTGFLFGTIGALIAISLVGKISGAHINPAVTLAFWVKGKMRGRDAAGYVIAQCAGAATGALPLVLWGAMGRSVEFAATFPGPSGDGAALAGELATTFIMVTGLFFFIGHSRLRRFTPLMFPFLYAVMVWLEAPISGTSTNPARSFGPSLVAVAWRGWWIYWLGPIAGALAAACAHQFTWLKRFEFDVAKVYHFTHDPRGVFHRGAEGPSPLARFFKRRSQAGK